MVKFLSKSIIIRLTSKWSQLSRRGVVQLSVVKPKFADFFSVAKIYSAQPLCTDFCHISVDTKGFA